RGIFAFGGWTTVARAPATPKNCTSLVEQALLGAGLRGGRVIVGLSGGVDSVALLHAVARVAAGYGVTTMALHVHHGLSPRADEWGRACAELCRTLNVTFTEVRVHIDRRSKLGIEGAAREARYAVFRQQQANAIALAHHADDQAETLLLQLLRGAGVRGLAAMPAARCAAGPALLRPWLAMPRAAIEAYAQSQGLSFVDDESNADRALKRNYLRHE